MTDRLSSLFSSPMDRAQPVDSPVPSTAALWHRFHQFTLSLSSWGFSLLSSIRIPIIVKQAAPFFNRRPMYSACSSSVFDSEPLRTYGFHGSMRKTESYSSSQSVSTPLNGLNWYEVTRAALRMMCSTWFFVRRLFTKDKAIVIPSPDDADNQKGPDNSKVEFSVGTLDDGRVMYTPIGILGEGGYGAVIEAEAAPHDNSLDGFPTQVAIKILPKSRMRRCRNVYQSVIGEINTFKRITMAGSLFLTRMLSSFQDDEYIYIVMRLYGEDLHHRVRDYYERMPVHEIRLYAAELLLAVENLHNLGIVHRDIKLSNVFVTANGHLSLADYSLATTPEIPEGGSFEDAKMFEAVGTPQRFAPEQLCNSSKDGYTAKVDIWLYGVCLLELYYGSGSNYFKEINGDDGRYEILNKDTSGDIKIRVEPREGIDLLIAILQRDPQKRPSIDDIKKHPYFRCIDWDRCEKGIYNTLHRPSRPCGDGDTTVQFSMSAEETSEEPDYTLEFPESMFNWHCPVELMSENKRLMGYWNASGDPGLRSGEGCHAPLNIPSPQADKTNQSSRMAVRGSTQRGGAATMNGPDGLIKTERIEH
ncbi:hypothetical protein EW146_g6717 [Bondarzewia mesenterica]|uniref:non-specific serine/threonine protein kinase n=1 Tax=Bondarzewia mesenterica TaxID=1095465 RepID=A0A4S4LMR3_9AGAM|nr:hypothetical protein EW146_g6717 [Bondarzewia mesenterica]